MSIVLLLLGSFALFVAVYPIINVLFLLIVPNSIKSKKKSLIINPLKKIIQFFYELLHPIIKLKKVLKLIKSIFKSIIISNRFIALILGISCIRILLFKKFMGTNEILFWSIIVTFSIFLLYLKVSTSILEDLYTTMILVFLCIFLFFGINSFIVSSSTGSKAIHSILISSLLFYILMISIIIYYINKKNNTLVSIITIAIIYIFLMVLESLNLGLYSTFLNKATNQIKNNINPMVYINKGLEQFYEIPKFNQNSLKIRKVTKVYSSHTTLCITKYKYPIYYMNNEISFIISIIIFFLGKVTEWFMLSYVAIGMFTINNNSNNNNVPNKYSTGTLIKDKNFYRKKIITLFFIIKIRYFIHPKY